MQSVKLCVKIIIHRLHINRRMLRKKIEHDRGLFYGAEKRIKIQKISGLFLRVFVLVFVVAVAVGIGRQAARYREVKDETASVAAQVKEERKSSRNLKRAERILYQRCLYRADCKRAAGHGKIKRNSLHQPRRID